MQNRTRAAEATATYSQNQLAARFVRSSKFSWKKIFFASMDDFNSLIINDYFFAFQTGTLWKPAWNMAFPSVKP
jgi:hypothetical protein